MKPQTKKNMIVLTNKINKQNSPEALAELHRRRQPPLESATARAQRQASSPIRPPRPVPSGESSGDILLPTSGPPRRGRCFCCLRRRSTSAAGSRGGSASRTELRASSNGSGSGPSAVRVFEWWLTCIGDLSPGTPLGFWKRRSPGMSPEVAAFL